MINFPLFINHSGIDEDNMMQYIDMAPALTTDATSLSVRGNSSLSGSKAGKQLLQHQDGNASVSSSLHVTIGSEVEDLSESAAASILAGEGEETNKNGGIIMSYFHFCFSSLLFSFSLSLSLSLSCSCSV